MLLHARTYLIEVAEMLDVLCYALIAVLFAVSLLYVRACEGLKGKRQ